MSTYEPPHIYDILDQDELRDAQENGHVREQTHPTEPLAILNYTEKCVYDNAWNDTLLQCRGLIYNTDNGDVVARPFPKFFNHGQAGAPDISLTDQVVVTDKIDGSLGILYRRPSDGFLAIATRGSFTSDQALHATLLLDERYGDWQPLDGDETTLLFEIVYPANRIVLDYDGLDDLVLLGSVDTLTGRILSPRYADLRWPGPTAKTFGLMTFAEALAKPPRKNAEGLVVRRTVTDEMVKLKQEDYVALHRIVTNLSTRTIWQGLAAGQTVEEIVAPLPDEFHPWAREVAEDVRYRLEDRVLDLFADFNLASVATGLRCSVLLGRRVQGSDINTDREAKKIFAQVVKDHPENWALFALLAGKDIRPKLWKQLEPPPGQTPSSRIADSIATAEADLAAGTAPTLDEVCDKGDEA